MQEAGLFGRVARKKREYKPAEIEKRLARTGENATRDWSKVLFSDEKTFYGKGDCGREWVRRPIGEALNPKFCAHKVAHPVKVNVWACFAASGQGYLKCFEGTMTGKKMREILSAELIPSAELHWVRGRDWHLLHDNDKKFTSHIVKDYLHRNCIETILIPPYSPDLNPIENLWAILARAVDKHAAATITELEDIIIEEWKRLSKTVMRKLGDSMLERCATVVEAEGQHTRW